MLLIIVFVLSTRAGPGILKKSGAMFGAVANKKKEPGPGRIKKRTGASAGGGVLKMKRTGAGAELRKENEARPMPGQIKSNEPGPGLGAVRAGLIK